MSVDMARFDVARAAYRQAADELQKALDERISARYAVLRDEDKQAGRDTGPRSVRARRAAAYFDVTTDPEHAAVIDGLRARVDEAHVAYRQVVEGEEQS